MEKIISGKNQAGQRLDKFLAKEFFNISRGEIIRQIKNGNVKVNNKIIKPSYILKENDVIEHGTWNMERANVMPNPSIKFEIIYEDENIIVVNKPAGIQVHPDYNEKNNTLVNGIVSQFPEIINAGDDKDRPGIVHRLDKDTSGIIIIARNQKTFEELKRKFQNREIEKKYWAIVFDGVSESGKLGESGVINKPLARSTNYRKQIIAVKKTKTKIREAITEYKVLKKWDNLALVEVTPKTGRFHQIRVHMASIGHPVVGDKLYKLKKIKNIDAPRQMLHAKSIKFELFGHDFEFEAKLPADFERFLA